MTFSLTKDFVILCEGAADRSFLNKLLEIRQINDFDLPDNDQLGKHEGWQSFGHKLSALAGDPSAYSRIKGVLVIADSSDSAENRFDEICQKIGSDGPFVANGFAKPLSSNVIAHQASGHPSISIMFIPPDRAGSLESICADAILAECSWIAACLESYLSCDKIDVLNWGAEKRDKARLQCLIAALNKNDPNKSLRYLFSVKPPMINLESNIFDKIVKNIIDFRDDLIKL